MDKNEEDILEGGREKDSAEDILKNIDEDKDVQQKELEGKQSKQLLWAVILMLALIIIIIAVPFINHNFINKFEYKGLEFQKTKLGDLIFYSVKFPVIAATGQVTGDYAVNFRIDPRELAKIPARIPNNRITFIQRSIGGYNPVYLTFDPDLKLCEDTSIALMNLAGFLRDSGLEISSASTDQNYSEENDLKHKDCDSSKVASDTIIKISEGNETSVTQLQKNCYEIKFKDCEILEGSERFMLVMLEEYASRFESV